LKADWRCGMSDNSRIKVGDQFLRKLLTTLICFQKITTTNATILI
jgi:hypothetical protein